MENLFKCKLCNYVYEGNEKPKVCLKCDTSSENIEELDNEATEKIYRSDKTNSFFAQLITLADEMIKVSEMGIEDHLDAGCIGVFEKTKDDAWIIKQRAKAEIETHVKKEKW